MGFASQELDLWVWAFGYASMCFSLRIRIPGVCSQDLNPWGFGFLVLDLLVWVSGFRSSSLDLRIWISAFESEDLFL